MSVVAVVGAQWGDEGKGRIVDLLAAEADLVARSQGGSNAGHTVVNASGTFRLHLVPSGIFHPHVTNVIGNGVMVEPQQLLAELDELHAHHVSTDSLVVSDRAHVVMPYHKLLDRLEEGARGAKQVGTTGRGIGPAVQDKVARFGIRVVDLLDPAVFREKLHAVLSLKNRVLTGVYGVEPLREEDIAEECLAAGARLAPRVGDTVALMQRAVADGKRVLLEGAQATLLDVDFGTYPFVTSSSPTVAGACVGLGLPPQSVTGAIGVYKAYLTRVGSGPFPTELNGTVGDRLRERGQEYGTTTGRPRRCGWFDATLARYSARLNGFTSIALTKLDVLDALPTVKVCTGYRRGQARWDAVPADASILAECEPVWEELPGWQTPTSDCRAFEDLPLNAQRYVDRIAALVGLPVALVSVGFAREQIIQIGVG
ncbi:MAG: adenylosuccinate synthase [Chloroflexi bacterium]|nr:adenylosuccinate synthase [Chloroflexota bacterium]